MEAPACFECAFKAGSHAAFAFSKSPSKPFNTSTLHASMTKSFMLARLHGLFVKSIVSSPYWMGSNFLDGLTAAAHLQMTSSVNSNMSLTSPYAWYNSIDVNSGLCLVDNPSFRKMRPISYTLSNPPMTKRFKCNSVAIRNVKSIFKALWCVLNGLASAPPETVCIIGVSISINSNSSSKYLLIVLIIFVL